MAEVISNGALMSRTDASGNPKPIGKQPHSSDFNPNSRATSGWSWRKGLAYPLPRYSPIIARESCDPVELSFEQQRRIWYETQRPFDLAAGPVMRADLFRIKDEEHVFVLVLHHIVCDGPSIAILLEELALFYGGFAKGIAIHIPEPRV